MTLFQTAAQMTGRPYNNEVSAYGDSRIANGLNIAGANYNITSRNIVGWARDLCKRSFRHDAGNVHGVGGYTSDQVFALLQANIAADTAATIVVLCSTNDRAAGWMAAQSIGLPLSQGGTNLQAIQDLVISYGKVLIWMNEMPRGGSNVLTGANLQAHLSTIRWFMQQSVVPGVYVADTFSALADLTSASASPLANMLGADSLHPAPIGAYTAALALKPIFDTLFPARPVLATGVVDLYDVTNNPRGAINANPMMTGTAGTKSAGAGTFNGTTCDSWTTNLLNATGLTVTGSQVTSSGKTWQQFAISGTPTSASPSIQTLSTAAIQSFLTIGDVIDQSVEIEIDVGQTGVLSIQTEASLSGLNRRDLSADVNWPATALSMVEGFRFTADAVATSFYKPVVNINLIQNAAVSATIRMARLAVRKVV